MWDAPQMFGDQHAPNARVRDAPRRVTAHEGVHLARAQSRLRRIRDNGVRLWSPQQTIQHDGFRLTGPAASWQ